MRPILPCFYCGTTEYVWANPEQYGEGGRYTRYIAVCENCHQHVYPRGTFGFDSEDLAMGAWNMEQRQLRQEKSKSE